MYDTYAISKQKPGSLPVSLKFRQKLIAHHTNNSPPLTPQPQREFHVIVEQGAKAEQRARKRGQAREHQENRRSVVEEEQYQEEENDVVVVFTVSELRRRRTRNPLGRTTNNDEDDEE